MKRFETRSVHRPNRPLAPQFKANCVCGWTSGWLDVAGMAHGAEADHHEHCEFTIEDVTLMERGAHPSWGIR